VHRLHSATAWYDNTNGEIGDICNGIPGTTLGSDGVTYYVQYEWSNSQNACATSGPSSARAITSANHSTSTIGTPGMFTVTTTGIPTPTISETGALPLGVTLVDNGNNTATPTGTP
jgi:hypothetical protein